MGGVHPIRATQASLAQQCQPCIFLGRTSRAKWAGPEEARSLGSERPRRAVSDSPLPGWVILAQRFALAPSLRPFIYSRNDQTHLRYEVF